MREVGIVDARQPTCLNCLSRRLPPPHFPSSDSPEHAIPFSQPTLGPTSPPFLSTYRSKWIDNFKYPAIPMHASQGHPITCLLSCHSPTSCNPRPSARRHHCPTVGCLSHRYSTLHLDSYSALPSSSSIRVFDRAGGGGDTLPSQLIPRTPSTTSIVNSQAVVEASPSFLLAACSRCRCTRSGYTPISPPLLRHEPPPVSDKRRGPRVSRRRTSQTCMTDRQKY